MNRWFRLREDGWLLLVLCLLLLFGGASAADASWMFVGLALFFVVPIVIIWFRQVTSRWCSECDRPMEMEPVTGGIIVNQWYRCGRCGHRRRSGVQLEWPE
jgi:DNA-directed RNA polymerase subunit RPC12/RpoP